MIRKFSLTLVLSLLLLPGCCSAGQSAVLVIVDGLGSAYVYPGSSPACADGSPLEVVPLAVLENASARYELWVPAPETGPGHAVLATGYSGASDEMLAYYEATIFDALRNEGCLCMAIMETGDSEEMIAEQDIAVHEMNNSVYAAEWVLETNGDRAFDGIPGILAADVPGQVKSRSDRAAAYRRYDEWPLSTATRLVRHMNASYPGQQYMLLVNIGGVDMAAHAGGPESYRSAIADLDAGLSGLAAACRDAGLALAITADHGMSFSSPGSKGSHGSGEASLRNESRRVPLLLFTGAPCVPPGIYGQECVAPTLLSLMGCPDSLSLEDGKTLTIGAATPMRRAGGAPKGPRPQDWLPYAVASAISVAGIVLALRTLRRG